MATTVNNEQIKAAVREAYGRVAMEEQAGGCCGCGAPASAAIGYSDEERLSAPEGADLGLAAATPRPLPS